MANGISIGEPIVNNAVDEDYLALPNIDAKYGPYGSVQEALSSIQVGDRAIGLTVGIKNGNELKEYWFKGGTANANLVLKQSNVDLSNYDTSAQVDTKIKKAVENIEVGGGTSPYTRAHMRKLHVKISGLGTNELTFADIDFKYGAENIISFTCDDANTSALSVIWSGINKRPISIHSADVENTTGKTYQYHANQYLAGDMPSDMYHAPFTKYLTYDTPFGKELIKPGVAIWPFATNHDGNFMDRTITVDKNATNLFRFMVPYLVWEDCNLIKRYGFDFYFHNIGTERYGASSDIYNVIQGLTGDMARTKEMLGRVMKIIARPDGNNVYMNAMLQMPNIDMAVAENTPAVPCTPYYQTEWFHKVWQRRFSDDIEGELKNTLTELYATDIRDKNWFHFCVHTADKKWADFLKFISETYGVLDKSTWFATVGELYEYMYYKQHNRILNTKFANGVFEFDYEFSYKENFNYKEMTLVFNPKIADPTGLANLSLEIKDANDSTYICPIQQLSFKEGKVWLLLGVEESIIENIEYFVSKYEETADIIWREDAELQLRKIDPARRAAFIARLDAVSPAILIETLSIPDQTINVTSAEPVQVIVNFTPANATNIDDIKLSNPVGNDLVAIFAGAGAGHAIFKLYYHGDYDSGGLIDFYINDTNLRSNSVSLIATAVNITSLSIPAGTKTVTNATPLNITVNYLPVDAGNYNTIVPVFSYPERFEYTMSGGGDGSVDFEIRLITEPTGAGGLHFKTTTNDIVSNQVTLLTGKEEIPITEIIASTPLLELSNKVAKEFTVTFNPANNTEMNNIAVSIDSNIDVTLKSTVNNIKTYSVVGKKDIPGFYSGNITIEIDNNNIMPVDIPYELTVIDEEPAAYELILVAPQTIEVDEAYSISISTKPPLNIKDNIRIDAANADTVIGNITYSANNNTAMCGILHKTVGKDTLRITCNVLPKNVITKEITVITAPEPTIDTFKFCCAAYRYGDNGSVLSLQDATYGGRINYEEFNNANSYFPNGSPILGVDGGQIPVTRNTVVTASLVEELGNGAHTYTGAKGASSANGDCSSVFTCNPEYKYFYIYNQTLGGGCAFNVPNGKYRVRLFSSTKEANDAYNNGGRVFINKVNVTDQLPTVPYRENNVWTSWVETTVSDGVISIIILTDKSKRVGLNACEVEKIE